MSEPLLVKPRDWIFIYSAFYPVFFLHCTLQDLMQIIAQIWLLGDKKVSEWGVSRRLSALALVSFLMLIVTILTRDEDQLSFATLYFGMVLYITNRQ